MDKYVKLSDLMTYPIRLDHYDKKHGNEHFVIGVESVLEYAECYATSEVQKIEYGTWENPYYDSDNKKSRFPCSVCGYGSLEYTNYCPDCGANMMGKKLPTWIPRDNWELGCEYDCPYCGETTDVPHGSIMPHKCWKCEKEIGVN